MSPAEPQTTRPEDALFVRFREQGDPAVLGRVYDLVAPALLHAATHLSGHPAEAEDLLQATLLAAIERRDAFDPARGPLRAWLFGILTNQARNQRARAGRRPDPERVSVRAELGPDEAAVADELKESLGRALERVPEAARPVLTLRLLHGLSPAEIARALERPPGTVRSQLQRGLEELRRHLPAGFVASGAWLSLFGRPARGLEAVRADVVVQAAALVPAVAATGATVSLVAGALTMKHVAAASIALLAGLGWWTVGRDAPRPAAPTAPVSLGPPPPVVQGDRGAPPAEATTRAAPARALHAAPAAAPLARTAPSVEPGAPEAATGTFVVRVLDPTGSDPVTGEVVTLEIFGDDSSRRMRIAQATDVEGRATFAEVPAGPVYARLLRGGEGGGRVTAGTVEVLELTLLEGLRVVGEVVDERLQPVPEAELWLSERWRPNSGHFVARADRAGRFQLEHLTQDHFVGARAPGFAMSHLRALRGATGSTISLRIVLLANAGSVRGRVVDVHGAPVAGAPVLVGDEDNHTPESGLRVEGGLAPAPPPQWLVTDADGRFLATSVPVGEVVVQARDRGAATVRRTVLVRPDAETAVELALVEAAAVRGRVTDGDGEPLAGVLVANSRDHNAFGASLTYSGPDGRYHLNDLAPGDVTLFARLERTLTEVTEERALHSGRTAEWNPVLAPGPVLHGWVVDASGAPLGGYTVVAVAPDPAARERLRSRRTEPDGRFVVRVDGAGSRHDLWVQGPGGWRAFPEEIRHDVLAGEDPLEIVVDDDTATTGTIRAALLDAHGLPAAEARLCVWQFEEAIWREFPADDAGAVEITNVPPGRVSLEVRATALPNRHLGEHALAGGETLDLGRITLSDGGQLAGRLVGDVEDERLASLRLQLFDAAFHQPTVVERASRSARAFRSGALAPGEYLLRVGGPFLAEQRLRVTIESGRDTHVEVPLVRAGLRRIVFVGPDEPAASDLPAAMWLQVFRGGQPVWSDMALMRDANGSLHADVSVLPGVYRFEGGTPDGLRVEGELDVVGYTGGQPPLHARLVRPF